ncbi:hypothetical protein ACFL45_10385 [Candidatus Neomarinimicrobiota bacterium]
MSSQSDQREAMKLLVSKINMKPSDLTLDELAQVLSEYRPNSDPGNVANTEILRRQFLFQERAAEAQEHAAEFQERAADAQASAASSMKASMWAMAATAAGTFAVALAAYIALLSK